MNNNELLRSLTQVLKLNEATIVDIFNLAQHPIDKASIANMLKNEGDTGFSDCDEKCITHFLDGLIAFRRGKNENSPLPAKEIAQPLSNNLILKKLRIAFDLKEDDLLELMSLANYEITKNELSATFRKPGHKHYRTCGEDFLMAFLIGLSYRHWN
jgi:uncharacterized protein YehS (DUF1456 family)